MNCGEEEENWGNKRFARQESEKLKWKNCWAMKAAGNRTGYLLSDFMSKGS